jgi:hypothetical protein
MSIEKELARRRFQTSADGIQRRHRQAQAQAARLSRTVTQTGTLDGVHPAFRTEVDAAREKARLAKNAPLERADLGVVLDKLRTEGKLPPVEKPDNVGYEPTPEEILGELAALPVSAPERLEDSPSVEDVLASGSGDDAAWDAPPAPGVAPSGAQPPPAPITTVALPGPVRQHTSKRGRK